MKYLLMVFFSLTSLKSISQVLKFKAFETYMQDVGDKSKMVSDGDWNKVDILIVVNYPKSKVNIYGKQLTDIDLLNNKEAYKNKDGDDWLVYNGIDENGDKCIVKLILFAEAAGEHMGNVVVEYPTFSLIYRFKKDE